MRLGIGGLLTIVGGGAMAGIAAAGLAGGVAGSSLIGERAVFDIPSQYLAAYESASARFSLGPDGWSYLAAIGRIESDHGRSPAAGVRSGQNAHGCCAGPMQIHNGFGSGGGTWAAFKVDGDQDGRADIYDIDDAAATAAHYLNASGGPSDWRGAVFAYNHASWYVADVIRWAAKYRAEAAGSPRGGTVGLVSPQAWLVEVSGFPGERCDRRIVADVLALVARYGVHLTDCFGGEPHALNGEHPLGLAADLVPADGDWDRTLQLATDAGWSPACARTGCPNQGPFRVVLYNGFPGHGDPHFSSRPHLHISWEHGAAEPFSPAPWVRVLRPGPS